MPKYYKVIAQLKRKEVSNRQIAEMLGISRNTVNSAVTSIIRSGKNFHEVSEMTDDEVMVKLTVKRKAAVFLHRIHIYNIQIHESLHRRKVQRRCVFLFSSLYYST